MTTTLLDALNAVNSRWAVVQANERTTRYLKFGRGTAVVLLLRLSSAAGPWPAVVEHLESTTRMLVPDCTASAPELGDWLEGFLEGVGVRSCVLVAAHDLCLPALQAALQFPERLERLILLTPPHFSPQDTEQALVTRTSHAGIPLLLLEERTPISEIISVLDSFARLDVA